MKKAGLFLVVILALSIVSLTGSADGTPAVYYVGGTGSGNYTSISQAIDAAGSGDRVIVYPGTYSPLDISKSLTIEGRQAVVPSIVVSAEHVNLSGFIVTGGSHGISIPGNHATVSGCIVLNHTYGITIEGSHACITGNHVFKNSYYGIWLKHAAAAQVDSNDVYRNHEGIYVHQADNATITSNAIANNTYGIHLAGTRHAAIYHNAILDNRERGLYYCCQSEENVIQGNVFIRNEVNAWGYDGANTWDDGSQGNYWDDSNGSSYIIDDDNIDHHPLQEPPVMPDFAYSIYILSPAAGQQVNGSVVIRGVSEQAKSVDIRVDNGSWTRAQGNFLWRAVLDSTTLANGTHIIQARCENATASLTVIVDNQAETRDAIPAVAPAGILMALSAALFLLRRRRFQPARHA